MGNKTVSWETKQRIQKQLQELQRMASEARTSQPTELPTWQDEPDYELEEEMEEIRSKDRERHFIQYSIEQGQNYRPASKTRKTLPAGLYKALTDQYGTFFQRQEIDMSELIRFEGTIADTIIGEFNDFWGKKSLYQERGEIHKRGFMLWGPPGGGKTSTVTFIMKDFINNGGVVFDFTSDLIGGIRQLKIVEPNRKIMIVMEDIDAWLHDYGSEQAILDMLDGSVKHSDTILIATTNYPERLPDRIINRPSRFDRVEYIGTPCAKDRKLYIKEKSKTLNTREINKWVKSTDGFTLAHVKELILSVEVFGLDFQDTLDRLNKMRKKLESSSDYEKELRGKPDSGFGFTR
jgi:hypothetical protein